MNYLLNKLVIESLGELRVVTKGQGKTQAHIDNGN